MTGGSWEEWRHEEECGDNSRTSPSTSTLQKISGVITMMAEEEGRRRPGRRESLLALSSDAVARDRHNKRPQDGATDFHCTTSATIASGLRTYDSPSRDRR